MSISLGTVSSPVVNGRCAGCGRFVSRNESHFHSPPRKFPGPPRAHLWVEGGGMVTRCDDIALARDRIMVKYARVEIGIGFTQLDDSERRAVELLFAADRAVVQRGRVVPTHPDDDECVWRWYPLPSHAKGPGVTTAVVWNP